MNLIPTIKITIRLVAFVTLKTTAPAWRQTYAAPRGWAARFSSPPLLLTVEGCLAGIWALENVPDVSTMVQTRRLRALWRAVSVHLRPTSSFKPVGSCVLWMHPRASRMLGKCKMGRRGGVIGEVVWGNKDWYQLSEFKGQHWFGYESRQSMTTSDLLPEAPAGCRAVIVSIAVSPSA